MSTSRSVENDRSLKYAASRLDDAGAAILSVLEADTVLAEARQSAGAVLITAAAAAEVHKYELDEALLALIPPTAIVPDILGVVAPPNLGRRLKAALGIEAYEDALFE